LWIAARDVCMARISRFGIVDRYINMNYEQTVSYLRCRCVGRPDLRRFRLRFGLLWLQGQEVNLVDLPRLAVMLRVRSGGPD
jgi:hypothetical protein